MDRTVIQNMIFVLGATGIIAYKTSGPTAIGTATTTVYIYVTGTATKSGTITIYGVK